MNRYIVGTVVVFDHPVLICWDNHKGHLDAVLPGLQEHLAGPEVGPYERAIIEHELSRLDGHLSRLDGHQLSRLDGYQLDVADRVPVWLRHRHARAIAERLVTDAIAQGYQVSVNDGEAWVVKRSTDSKAIMAALFSTDEDYIRIRKDGEQSSVGTFTLIYGNDGWDVIADWSYSVETEAVMQRIQRGASELATAIEIKYGA